MKNRHCHPAILVLTVFAVTSFCCICESSQGPQVSAVSFSSTGWQEYSNDQQGYRLLLPPEVQTIFKKKRAREEASQNLLPFDYVNFSMKQAGDDKEPFELGLGVHWNKYNLKTRVFADNKDIGVKKGVRQYVTLRSSTVTVAGIEGVRDDFSLEKESGWTTYSRVIIPCGDRFFCFLCTLGRDKAVPEYEQVFRRIVESFEVR
jgi:hypothetical protein